MIEEKRFYCEMDVTILREGMMKFRDSFIMKNAIDPLWKTCTIASACMLEFRTHHLLPNTIGLIPPGGYHRRERQSRLAIM